MSESVVIIDIYEAFLHMQGTVSKPFTYTASLSALHILR